jgi:serine/threonine-protein kinase
MGHNYRYRPGQLVPGTGLKIIRPLGSGGMGAVYEVEETSVEAPFVMKVVHPHLLLPGSNAAERMRQEAKTQARLHHKNIVRVYRAGVTAESPPLPFYVMDRLSGYSVRQAIRWHSDKGAFLPLGWVLWIGASVLQALDHAHTNGVVHRDVKPDNIFIHRVEGEKPVVKLLDFGIVAALSELSDKTRLTAGGFAGTMTYAAPEQLEGAKPAPTMDIYSTGMVLFEMLTGRRPFEDRKTPEDLIRAQLHELPPPISRAGVHPKLRALVAQMLAKQPEQRPQTARDALRQLSQIKVEWVQHNTDIAAGDSVEFQFDVDLGERWPSQGAKDESFPSAESRERRSGALSDASELARVPPLELGEPSDARHGSVPTRSSWWNTVDRYKSRVRVSHVLLAALGFAGLTGAAAWLWMGAPSAQSPSTTSPSSHVATVPDAPSAIPTSPLAVPVPPPPTPSSATAPAMDAGTAPGQAPTPLPIATKTRPLATSGHAAAKAAPALAKPSGTEQSPAAEPSPKNPATGAPDDPMRP